MKRTPTPLAPPELVIVKSLTTPKLSTRAAGLLSYQVGYLPDRSEIYLQLTGNEGGGYFSNEWLPVTRLFNKLAELKPFDAIAATALKSVFAGKSSNNASFLAAVLAAEGLLVRNIDKESRLVVSPSYSDWSTQIIALDGVLTNTAPPTTGNAPEASPPQNKKSKKESKKPSDDAQAETTSELTTEG